VSDPDATAPTTPTTPTTAMAAKPQKRRFVDVGVANAVFLRSDPGLASMPPIDTAAPEVAFWGKSNVGKSSLLNALLLKKSLVKTSKTPGHTQLLNQFGVTVNLRRSQRHLTLVDLPGYGFAQMPRAQQVKLGKMLGEYISGRTGLSALVHLFDLRHAPTALDVETWQQVSVLSPHRIVVGTKADRVPKSKHRAHAKVIAQALGIHADDVTVFSSEDRTGRAALWARILAATGVAQDDLSEPLPERSSSSSSSSSSGPDA
jgi:GTP-binding protein